MRAVLLCAGRGRRFEGALGNRPKVLIEVAPGLTLLERHLAIFDRVLDGVTLVVGYEQQQIREAAPGADFAHNPRFTEGSMISLLAAAEVLERETCIVMDADVLYGEGMYRRLCESPHDDAVLFDAAFLDDEMRIGLIDGRVRHLSKKLVNSDYEAVGRGPGFYKVSPAWGARLVETMRAMDAEGLGHVEYEDAMNRTFEAVEVRPVPTAGDPWTEIDHNQDLRRAREEIWPRLR